MCEMLISNLQSSTLSKRNTALVQATSNVHISSFGMYYFERLFLQSGIFQMPFSYILVISLFPSDYDFSS